MYETKTTVKFILGLLVVLCQLLQTTFAATSYVPFNSNENTMSLYTAATQNTSVELPKVEFDNTPSFAIASPEIVAAMTDANATNNTIFAGIDEVLYRGEKPEKVEKEVGSAYGFAFQTVTTNGTTTNSTAMTSPFTQHVFGMKGETADVGLSKKEWAFSFGLRASTASSGILFCVADAWESVPNSACDTLHQVEQQNTTAEAAPYVVYAAMEIDGANEELVYVTKSPAGSLERVRFENAEIFDGEWHLIALTFGELGTATIAQLVVDGRARFSDDKQRKCIPEAAFPVAIPETPTYTPTSGATTFLPENGVLVMGHYLNNVSLYNLQLHRKQVTARDSIEMGAPWMLDNLEVGKTFGYTFFWIFFVIGLGLFGYTGFTTYTEVMGALKSEAALSMSAAAKKASKQGTKTAAQLQNVGSKIMSMRSKAARAHQAAVQPAVLQQLALIVPLVLQVFQGLSIYFHSWEWPQLFKDVMEKIIFIFAFDLTLPALSIPPYVTLILQLGVTLICIYGFYRFGQNDEAQFLLTVQRFKTAIAFNELLLFEQLLQGAAEVDVKPGDKIETSYGERTFEEIAKLAAKYLVEEHKEVTIEQLVVLDVPEEVAEEAVLIIGDPPTTALSAFLQLFALQNDMEAPHEAIESLSTQLLVTDWTKFEKKKKEKKKKDDEEDKKSKQDKSDSDSWDDSWSDSSFSDSSDDDVEPNEKASRRIIELSNAAFGKVPTKTSLRMVWQLTQLAEIVKTDDGIEEDSSEKKKDSTKPKGDDDATDEEMVAAKATTSAEPTHDPSKGIVSEVAEKFGSKHNKELAGDADGWMNQIEKVDVIQSMIGLQVLRTELLPHPPEDGTQPAANYTFIVERFRDGRKFRVENRRYGANQLRVLRWQVEKMFTDQKTRSGMIRTLTLFDLDSDEPEEKKRLVEYHNVFVNENLTLDCKEEGEAFATIVDVQYTDGLTCPEHGCPLIPAVEHLHYQVKMVDGRSPYVCCHEKSIAFKIARDGSRTSLEPCVQDNLFVCSDDSCCFSVCNVCAEKAVPKAKRLFSKVHRAKYVTEHSASGIIPLIMFMILQALLLPVMQNTLLVLACHPSFQCQFPDCYSNPTASFMVSVVVSAMLLVFFRGGITVMWSWMLWSRYKLLLPHVTSESLWNRLLDMDSTILSALYRKYEFKYMMLEPLYVFITQSCLTLSVTFAEPNSKVQMTTVASLEGLNGAFLATTNPFFDPIMDALSKLGNVHQLIQLALVGHHRGNLVENAKSSSVAIAMLAVALIYMMMVIFIIIKTVILPLFKARSAQKAQTIARKEHLYLLQQQHSEPERTCNLLSDLIKPKKKHFGKKHVEVALTMAHIARISGGTHWDGELEWVHRAVQAHLDALLEQRPKAMNDSHGFNQVMLSEDALASLTFAMRHTNEETDFSQTPICKAVEKEDESNVKDLITRLLEITKLSSSEEKLGIASRNCFMLALRLNKGLLDSVDVSGSFLGMVTALNCRFVNVNFKGCIMAESNFHNSFFDNCEFDSVDATNSQFGQPKPKPAIRIRKFDFGSDKLDSNTGTRIFRSRDGNLIYQFNPKGHMFNTIHALTGTRDHQVEEVQSLAHSQITPHVVYLANLDKPWRVTGTIDGTEFSKELHWDLVCRSFSDEFRSFSLSEDLLDATAEAKAAEARSQLDGKSASEKMQKKDGDSDSDSEEENRDAEVDETTARMLRRLAIAIAAPPGGATPIGSWVTLDSNWRMKIDGYDVVTIPVNFPKAEFDIEGITFHNHFLDGMVEERHDAAMKEKKEEKKKLKEQKKERGSDDSDSDADSWDDDAYSDDSDAASDLHKYRAEDYDSFFDDVKSRDQNIEMAPDGSWWVGIEGDEVIVYGWEEKQRVSSFTINELEVNKIAVAASSKYFCLQEELKGRVYKVEKDAHDDWHCTPVCTVGGTSQIADCAFSWSEKEIWTYGDGWVSVYNNQTGRALRNYALTTRVEGVGEDSDSDYSGSDSDEEDDLRALKEPGYLSLGPHPESFVVLIPENDIMYLLDGNSSTRRINPEIPLSMGVSPDNKIVATAFFSGRVGIFDATTGSLLSVETSKHNNMVKNTTFTNDGKEVITVCQETIMLWGINEENYSLNPIRAINIYKAIEVNSLLLSSDSMAVQAALVANDSMIIALESDFVVLENAHDTTGDTALFKTRKFGFDDFSYDLESDEPLTIFTSQNGRIAVMQDSGNGVMICRLTPRAVDEKKWMLTKLQTLMSHNISVQNTSHLDATINFVHDGKMIYFAMNHLGIAVADLSDDALNGTQPLWIHAVHAPPPGKKRDMDDVKLPGWKRHCGSIEDEEAHFMGPDDLISYQGAKVTEKTSFGEVEYVCGSFGWPTFDGKEKLPLHDLIQDEFSESDKDGDSGSDSDENLHNSDSDDDGVHSRKKESRGELVSDSDSDSVNEEDRAEMARQKKLMKKWDRSFKTRNSLRRTTLSQVPVGKPSPFFLVGGTFGVRAFSTETHESALHIAPPEKEGGEEKAKKKVVKQKAKQAAKKTKPKKKKKKDSWSDDDSWDDDGSDEDADDHSDVSDVTDEVEEEEEEMERKTGTGESQLLWSSITPRFFFGCVAPRTKRLREGDSAAKTGEAGMTVVDVEDEE